MMDVASPVRWVIDDITADVFQFLFVPNDVFPVIALPKPLFKSRPPRIVDATAITHRCPRLPCTNNISQLIYGVVFPRNKSVKMIRHQDPFVQFQLWKFSRHFEPRVTKSMPHEIGFDIRLRPFRTHDFSKMGKASLGANCDEIGSRSAVIIATHPNRTAMMQIWIKHDKNPAL